MQEQGQSDHGGAAEIKHYGLTTAIIPGSLALLGGGDRRFKIERVLLKKGVWREGDFNCCIFFPFSSHCPTLLSVLLN